MWQVRICNFLASSYSHICKWEVKINMEKKPQQNKTCSVIEWCLFSGYLPWPLIKQALWRIYSWNCTKWWITVCEQSSLENPHACFFSCKFVKWKIIPFKTVPCCSVSYKVFALTSGLILPNQFFLAPLPAAALCIWLMFVFQKCACSYLCKLHVTLPPFVHVPVCEKFALPLESEKSRFFIVFMYFHLCRSNSYFISAV